MYGEIIKDIRTAMGLNQIEFAERLGVHQVQVARWEIEYKSKGSKSTAKPNGTYTAMILNFAHDIQRSDLATQFRLAMAKAKTNNKNVN